MTSARAAARAERLIALGTARGLKVATAESCTGGMVVAALTAVAGSSAVVDRSFVTYSNEAKHELLGVPLALIDRFGAVSAEVARAMAAGALKCSRADIAVAITGIAGPSGGSAGKPVGLVWFALAAGGVPTRTERRVFSGASRALVRARATETALALIERAMLSDPMAA
ncbi:MAG: CinA family protein [Parvularculaceae bacterium]|nr:CinA family protein [Parvularculaceae bacterium]